MLRNQDEPISTDRIRDQFSRIKNMGFTGCGDHSNCGSDAKRRALRSDGAAGEHFEHLLGVKENNLHEPDFEGWEVKTKRESGGYASLFNLACDNEDKTVEWVREQFGKVNEDWPEHKKLYCSLYHHRHSKVYKKWLMQLKLDDNQEKMFLVVRNLEGDLVDDSIFWNYQSIENRAQEKMGQGTFLATDISERISSDGSTKEFRYDSASAYFGFDFSRFLEGIRDGVVQYDFRLSTYGKDSIRAGEKIDKGCGFRLKGKEFYTNFYEYQINLG